MNSETTQYWPSEKDFNEEFRDGEFSLDQQEQFDVVRAGISNGSLNDLIRRACENDSLSPAKKKWTLRELDFIESTSIEDQ